MNETRVCPCCGYDLIKDALILINDFSMMGPSSQLLYKGNPLQLTSAERVVTWAIIKAFPRAVTFDAILNRLDSESEGNLVDVYLSRIRTKLRAIGAPIPFEMIGGKVGQRAVIWGAL